MPEINGMFTIILELLRVVSICTINSGVFGAVGVDAIIYSTYCYISAFICNKGTYTNSIMLNSHHVNNGMYSYKTCGKYTVHSRI
jgi:hypothetical protein